MGNKASAQTFPLEAVIAEAVRAANIFGPVFVKAYSVAVVRKLQQLHDEEHEGVERVQNKDGFLLERPPIATEPMDRGWITKLGDIKKNWKRRYFVATEEADNFVVYYFEKEKDAATPVKAKGSIFPCGYVIRNTTAEEDARDRKDKDASEFGLAMEPLDKKRQWVMRFDSDETRVKWKQVLQFASLKCQPPLVKDPILNDTFKDAYERTRRQLGLHGYYRLDRPEKEQLQLLLSQACEANVLASLADALPAAGAGAAGGAEADKVRAAAEKELDRIVTAVADTAWPAIATRLELRRDAVDDVAEGSLGSILREEEMRKAEVRDRTAKFIRPVARDVAAPVVGVVLGALLKPLYKAHKEAIKMFWHRIHDIVERGLKENELRQFYRDTRWQNHSLAGAWRKIRALTRGEVDETDAGDAALKLLSDLTVPVPELVALMGGVSLYEVETQFEDGIRQLVGWATYSFVAAVERARGGVTPIECLHGVMRSMIHDSKIRQRKALASIFRAVLLPATRKQSLAVPAVKEVAATSVAYGSTPFVVVPYTPPPPPAPVAEKMSDKEAAANAAANALVPVTTTGAAATILVPAATAIAKTKKSITAAQAEIKASPLAEVFLDADWMLEDVLGEAVDSAVAAIVEPKSAAMLGRLDKLPGKLGFAAAAAAAAATA